MSIVSRISDLATRIGTELKSIRTLLNGNVADLAALSFTPKTNIVAALNALKSEIDSVASAGGATINDASSSSSTQTYSINKILDIVSDLQQQFADADQDLKDSILGGASAAYDTLVEIQAFITDQGTDLGQVLTDLGNRLRFDAPQSLTAPQKAQACSNAGALSLVQSGDPDTNYVTVLESALA